MLPILAALAGACLIGLLVYGVTAQSASRTLDERVAAGQRPARARRRAHAAACSAGGRARRSLAALQGQGRGAELLGLVVRAVPGGGAAAGARPEPSCARHDGTVLGVTYLDASPDSRAFVRALPPHLPEPARQRPATSRTPTAPTSCPESFVIDRQRPRRRGLPRRDRPGVPRPRDRARARARERRARARRSARRRSLAALARACGGAPQRPRRGHAAPARVAAGDRTPGDVRDVQDPAERRRVAAGRPRARLHPGPDRPRARPKRRSSSALVEPVRPDGARAAERRTASTSTAYLVPLAVVLALLGRLLACCCRAGAATPARAGRRASERAAALSAADAAARWTPTSRASTDSPARLPAATSAAGALTPSRSRQRAIVRRARHAQRDPQRLDALAARRRPRGSRGRTP